MEKPIVILLPYTGCSGLELFGIRFAQDLISRNQNAIVAAPKDSLIENACKIRGVPCWHFPITEKYNLKSFFACCKMYKELDPTAIIGFRSQTVYPMHFARLITGIHPKLLLFYRVGVGNKNRKDPIHRIMFKQLAAVVPNADYVGDKIKRLWAIDLEKVVCIKSGVDICKYKPDDSLRNKLRQELGLKEDDILIGTSGRIESAKGSETLLRAVFGDNGSAKGRKEVHLAYFGRGSDTYIAHLRRLAKEFGVDKQCYFPGFRDKPEEIYPAFDIFAFAVEVNECYAYIVLEAMASGLAPIIPTSGGLVEMLDDNIQGFFFTHKSIDSLRETISKVLALPKSELKEKGNAARRKIENHATWNKMMEKYLTLFKKCGIKGF